MNNSFIETTRSDDELASSKLGTIEYWNDAYKRDLDNFNDHGDEGEIWFGRQSVLKIIKWIKECTQIVRETSKIIDIGCGNGHTCIQLAKEGYANILGIDYSLNAIELAQQIAKREQLKIEYRVFDIFNHSTTSALNEITCFDLCIDKGTYDAISLCPLNSREKRRAYKLFVKSLMHTNSFFLCTSCNWTSDELKEYFSDEFRVYDEILLSNFTFGGRAGQKTSNVIFMLLNK